ncbi:MAG: oxidoreductase [Gammaproteobacteria bacterium]|nr:oxidoreductase [Gammaproteobacteria bacterium]
MADRFKAFQITEIDGKARGAMTDISLPDLNPGEVVIRNRFSSINYKDALANSGAGKIARRTPLVGGIDLAGEVVSSEDARFKPGDAVVVTGYGLSETRDGGYAQYSRVEADLVVPLPNGLSMEQAMALGTAGFTAGLAVHRLEQNGLKPDQGRVVVTGATGGVGSLITNMLGGRGYNVTAVTGKPQQQPYLETIGASEFIDRNTLDYGKRPLEKALWAGAADSVGGDMLAWLTRTVQPWGSIASYGLAGGIKLETTVMPFIIRGVNLLGIDSVTCPMSVRAPLWQRLASDLKPEVLDSIYQTIPFSELSGAFNQFLDGSIKGRIVVAID